VFSFWVWVGSTLLVTLRMPGLIWGSTHLFSPDLLLVWMHDGPYSVHAGRNHDFLIVPTSLWTHAPISSSLVVARIQHMETEAWGCWWICAGLCIKDPQSVDCSRQHNPSQRATWPVWAMSMDLNAHNYIAFKSPRPHVLTIHIVLRTKNILTVHVHVSTHTRTRAHTHTHTHTHTRENQQCPKNPRRTAKV
jgi:hypothetical protein